jgi:hypothetical protein
VGAGVSGTAVGLCLDYATADDAFAHRAHEVAAEQVPSHLLNGALEEARGHREGQIVVADDSHGRS